MEKSLAERLIELESAYGLLQHDFEAQNEMVLENSRLINHLEVLVRRLSEQIDQLQTATDDEPGSLEDERPPHY